MADTDLSDAQWELVKDCFVQPAPSKLGGRPRRTDVRAILNGVLWILRTGAQWKFLPDEFPPRATCHRYHQQWSRDGAYAKAFAKLARDARLLDDDLEQLVRSIARASGLIEPLGALDRHRFDSPRSSGRPGTIVMIRRRDRRRARGP